MAVSDKLPVDIALGLDNPGLLLLMNKVGVQFINNTNE